jgi:hypothetical protein
MSKSTAIRKINLHILRVDLIRPWLNFEVFNLQNWKIQGIKAGYYSSGSTDKNNGMFPLLTQTVLIGTKISVEGNFSQKDIRIVTEHKEAGNDISFGSFLLNTISNVIEVFQTEGGTKLNSNIHQVVGYISKVVPMSPSL